MWVALVLSSYMYCLHKYIYIYINLPSDCLVQDDVKASEKRRDQDDRMKRSGVQHIVHPRANDDE